MSPTLSTIALMASAQKSPIRILFVAIRSCLLAEGRSHRRFMDSAVRKAARAIVLWRAFA
jgi:hypothetical protein